MNKKKILAVLFFIIIVIDQTTKIILIDKEISIIHGLLEFNYTENTGYAFGIGTNNILIVIILNIMILLCIIKLIKHKKESVYFPILIGLILTLAGGVSNLIDRIFRGYVIDFIDVNVLNYPNFNIADISIVIGIFLLIIFIIKSLFKKEEKS